MASDQTHLAIDSVALKRALDRAAWTYESAAVLERTIGDCLLERLNVMRINPRIVLDLGARTGYTAEQLQRRYPEAKVIGIDYSAALLASAPATRDSSLTLIAGNYTELPLPDHSCDLIFSNLTLHWSEHIQTTFQECQRLLKPGGLLLFTTIGPDTLKELRNSFADGKYHVHPFFDMHDLGDLLRDMHFSDPVMDAERLTVRYASVTSLLQDLKQTGAKNALRGRHPGLMGKNHWQTMLDNYERLRDPQQALPATVELIYGHAFSPFQKKRSTEFGEEIYVSVDQLKIVSH